MPRYFFHVHDDVVTEDDEGAELADADGARRQATTAIRAMICDEVRTHGRIVLHHWIGVTDEAGATVMIVRFDEAVRVED